MWNSYFHHFSTRRHHGIYTFSGNKRNDFAWLEYSLLAQCVTCIAHGGHTHRHTNLTVCHVCVSWCAIDRRRWPPCHASSERRRGVPRSLRASRDRWQTYGLVVVLRPFLCVVMRVCRWVRREGVAEWLLGAWLRCC